MLLLLGWLCTVSTTIVAASSTPEPFNANIVFYRDVKYGSILGTLKMHLANRCINFDCGHSGSYLDNNVSSVQWTGMPKTATYKGESRAQVAFYADKNCKGSSQQYPTGKGGVQSFATTRFNDVISSFMVLQFSSGIENGIHAICELGARKLSVDGDANE